MKTRPVTVKLTDGELLAIQVLIDTRACDSVSDALVQGLYMLLESDPDTRQLKKEVQHDRDFRFRRRRTRRVGVGRVT
jgi:site-specific recombinase